MTHFPLPFSLKAQRELAALAVMSCALDRISSYTVSSLKRHYSIDDVLSRVSFVLSSHTLLTGRTLQRRAVKPLPLLSFSNGKGYTALAQTHLDHEEEE